MKEARKTALIHAWRKQQTNFVGLTIALVYYLAFMRGGDDSRFDHAMKMYLIFAFPVIILLMLQEFIK